MSDDHTPSASPSETFAWHPDYAGRTADKVRRELAYQIEGDQRQHRLAMEGADEAEHDALASVVTLERRWGQYDFDWAEQDANTLADRIVRFELERERRQEMISWSEYRSSVETSDEHLSEYTSPRELSTTAKGMALLAIVVVIVLILLVLAVL